MFRLFRSLGLYQDYDEKFIDNIGPLVVRSSRDSIFNVSVLLWLPVLILKAFKFFLNVGTRCFSTVFRKNLQEIVGVFVTVQTAESVSNEIDPHTKLDIKDDFYLLSFFLSFFLSFCLIVERN